MFVYELTELFHILEYLHACLFMLYNDDSVGIQSLN